MEGFETASLQKLRHLTEKAILPRLCLGHFKYISPSSPKKSRDALAPAMAMLSLNSACAKLG